MEKAGAVSKKLKSERFRDWVLDALPDSETPVIMKPFIW